MMSGVTLLVQNLSDQVNDDELLAIFQDFGNVLDAEVAGTLFNDNENTSIPMTVNSWGRPEDHGFVTMSSAKDAKQAIRKGNGLDIDGLHIQVTYCDVGFKGYGDVCYAHLRGECTRGERCRFYHPRTAPDAMPGSADKRSNLSGVCHAFQQGHYTLGNGGRDRRPAAAKGRGVCYANLRGRCTRGSSCRYRHVRPEVTWNTKDSGKVGVKDHSKFNAAKKDTDCSDDGSSADQKPDKGKEGTMSLLGAFLDIMLDRGVTELTLSLKTDAGYTEEEKEVEEEKDY